MSIGRILARAWEIIWRNKVLWVFGVLASCAGGGYGSGSGIRGNQNFDLQVMAAEFDRLAQGFENFVEGSGATFVVAVLCLVALLGILVWAAGIFGKLGLIHGTLRAEEGQPIHLPSLANSAWTRLVPAMGLNLLLGLFALLGVALLILIGWGLASVALPLNVLLGLAVLIAGSAGLACVVLPVAVAFSIISEVANVALVKERLGAAGALSKAWRLLRSQPRSLAGLAVVLFIVGLVVSLVISIPTLTIAIPMLFDPTNPTSLERSFRTAVPSLLILPILLALQGILLSYLQSAWTLGYLQLAPSEAPAKVPSPRKTEPKGA